MSRQVNLGKPLSDKDREYLLNRGRRHLVLQNDRTFGRGEFAGQEPEVDPEEVDDEGTEVTDDEWETQVEAMNMDQLRAALQRRGLPTNGKKDDLQDRLIEAGPED